ncbi:MAG: BatD family protein [Myxococcales bacterium]
MRSLALTLTLALWCWFSAAGARADSVRLSMSASSTRVQAGEPFAVEVRAELSGSSDDDTEIDLPEFDHFEVLGRRVSRPFSFSFGFGGGQQARMQSQLIYSFTLRGLNPGRYVIQPAVITVGGRKYASRPLTIEVTASAAPGDPNAGVAPGAQPSPDLQAGNAGNPLDGARFDPEMFVRTAVDRHRAYVGEQVTVTIYLYVRGGLHETPSVSREPTNEGFWTQDLLPPQRSLSATRQEINGRVFSAYVLRRYAAFPMRAGKLQIGPPAVETSGISSVFDIFSGPSQPVRRNGVPVTIEAAELPTRANAKLPVHVGQLTLEASLDPPRAKVGDAVTLRVVARGQGNLRALKLPDPVVAGVEVLPPEIDDQVTTDLDQVGGERVFRWLLLPREPGSHRVAPFSVDVLDPRTGIYAPVRSPELPLDVTGTALAAVPGATAGANPANAGAAATGAATSTGAAGENLPSYGPARPQSALLRAERPLHTEPWFWWTLLAAPVALGAALAGQWGLRRWTARKPGAHSKEQAFKAASGHLERARSAAKAGDAQTVFAALTQTLKGALEAQLAEPIGGLTRKALRGHLEQRGMAAALAGKLIETLEQLDQARFAPAPQSSAELEQWIGKSSSLLPELQRFSPRGER